MLTKYTLAGAEGNIADWLSQNLGAFILVLGLALIALGVFYILKASKIFNYSIIIGGACLGFVVGRSLSSFWGISDGVTSAVFSVALFFSFAIFAFFVYKISLYVYTAITAYLLVTALLNCFMADNEIAVINISVAVACICALVFIKYTRVLVLAVVGGVSGYAVGQGLAFILTFISRSDDGDKKMIIVSVIIGILVAILAISVQYKRVIAKSDSDFSEFDYRAFLLKLNIIVPNDNGEE